MLKLASYRAVTKINLSIYQQFNQLVMSLADASTPPFTALHITFWMVEVVGKSGGLSTAIFALDVRHLVHTILNRFNMLPRPRTAVQFEPGSIVEN